MKETKIFKQDLLPDDKKIVNKIEAALKTNLVEKSIIINEIKKLEENAKIMYSNNTKLSGLPDAYWNDYLLNLLAKYQKVSDFKAGFASFIKGQICYLGLYIILFVFIDYLLNPSTYSLDKTIPSYIFTNCYLLMSYLMFMNPFSMKTIFQTFEQRISSQTKSIIIFIIVVITLSFMRFEISIIHRFIIQIILIIISFIICKYIK